MKSQKDYYSILGVDKNATADDIRKAYRTAALLHHPDRNPPEKKEAAEAKFKELSEAHEVLSDPDKKKRYDQGDEILAGSWGGGAWDAFSVVNDFFGRRAAPKASDILIDLTIDFIEAVKGCKKTVEVTRALDCANCGGTGAEEFKTCERCGGKGFVVMRQSPFMIQTPCGQCRGGRVPAKPCGSCKGTGKAQESVETIEVAIPAGIEHGMRMRIAGKGQARSGMRPGDLGITLLVNEHKDFVRFQHNDLLTHVELSYHQLVAGCKLDVPTIDGVAEIKVPSLTEPGNRFRLEGLGVPDLRNGEMGDLYVGIRLKMPQKVSAEYKKLLKELDKLDQ